MRALFNVSLTDSEARKRLMINKTHLSEFVKRALNRIATKESPPLRLGEDLGGVIERLSGGAFCPANASFTDSEARKHLMTNKTHLSEFVKRALNRIATKESPPLRLGEDLGGVIERLSVGVFCPANVSFTDSEARKRSMTNKTHLSEFVKRALNRIATKESPPLRLGEDLGGVIERLSVGVFCPANVSFTDSEARKRLMANKTHLNEFVKRALITIAFLSCLTLNLVAQQVAPRAEFVSYDIREVAEAGIPSKSNHYVELKLTERIASDGNVEWVVVVDLPYVWLDRDLFMQVEGVANHHVEVNKTRFGEVTDSRTPKQFHLSNHITDGSNTIVFTPITDADQRLESASGTASAPRVTLFSQPKLRIEDFAIKLEPDSTGKHGILELSLYLSNSYNFPETITVGYDIFTPTGELHHYDFKEVTIDGQGRDTLTLIHPVWRTNSNSWSDQTPLLYGGMLSIKRKGNMIEYIPYKVGFGTTRVADGKILRNGTPIEIRAIRYTTVGDRKSSAERIAALKKSNANTLITDSPQPIWFYEICDKLGMYVIEQANIDAGEGTTRSLKIGGTPSNDPKLLGEFMARTEAMYARVRNHTCIIGWSLGGEIGNGYNMYQTYLWLKAMDSNRAVIFNEAEGEWNSDLEVEIINIVAGRSDSTSSSTPTTKPRR